MKWTYDKPNTPGYYWYRSIKDSKPGEGSRPVILYVNSDLYVSSMMGQEYNEPVSVNEFNGFWAGPIQEPEDSKEMDNLAAMMWEIF